MECFHENMKPTLEKVLEQYGRETSQQIYNTIVKPCRRLVQKCSFKSLSDMSRLCSLAYWLYIYDQKELALEICEHTHGADFAFEDWMNGYPELYGLEIRIARELLGENRKEKIPPNLLEFYLSKRVEKELKFPEVLREERITTCCDRLLSTELLFALYNLIGKGETGLYPDLNKNWGEIEKTIAAYIDCLRKGFL